MISDGSQNLNAIRQVALLIMEQYPLAIAYSNEDITKKRENMQELAINNHGKVVELGNDSASNGGHERTSTLSCPSLQTD
jgi:hypothetical protein